MHASWDPGAVGWGHRKTLHSGQQARFIGQETQEPTRGPLGRRRQVSGFCVGGEILWGGESSSSFTSSHAVLRDRGLDTGFQGSAAPLSALIYYFSRQQPDFHALQTQLRAALSVPTPPAIWQWPPLRYPIQPRAPPGGAMWWLPGLLPWGSLHPRPGSPRHTAGAHLMTVLSADSPPGQRTLLPRAITLHPGKKPKQRPPPPPLPLSPSFSGRPCGGN